MPVTKDQCRGCIVGLAVGDAVGAPVECGKTEETRSYIENRVKPKDFEKVGSIRSQFEDLPFGHVTDDTQMMRELVISMADLGDFDPEDVANRFAVIFENGRIVGSGQTTRTAINRLLRGESWQHSGYAKSAGNGSAMRVAPIGLVPNEYDVVPYATTQGIITHTHGESKAASVLTAKAVYYAANNETIDPVGCLDYCLSDLGDAEFSSDLDHLRDLFLRGETNRESVLEWMKSLQDDTIWHGISPYAKTSTFWAVYAFLMSPDDFWQTIQMALWPAGDVDTIAAMAGAISGAYNGFGAIPEEILSHIHEGEYWEVDGLLELADRFYESVVDVG